MLWDASVAADFEAHADSPLPDLGRTGVPPRAGDLGTWLRRPGQPDRLGHEFGGTPRPLHGKFGKYGARKLLYGQSRSLVLERAHGFREFFQAVDPDRVIEQANRGTCRSR